ncbi:MAG: RDD family protein [Treponema sp.]|jgi:uncharacterized RDD family membrane protein YckC|nr:RDD family protein [Treponema sp.]
MPLRNETAGLDSRVTVETPEGIEFTLFPAGPLIRGCAWGIDVVIQWTLLIVLTMVSDFFGDSLGSWMLLLLFFFIDWFYHVGWEILGRGQSPGKRLLGIRVVRSDGSPVNPGASFLRNLLRFADTFLFLCPIALIVMLLSRGFRRLGDWTGDTLVVYTAQSLSITAMPLKIAGEGPRRILPSLGFDEIPGEEKQGILMFARRYPLLGKARANEIAAPYVKALRNKQDAGEFYPVDDAPAGEAADYLLGISRKLSGDS